MITLDDIKKLTKYQIVAFVNVFATKEDFQSLKQNFFSLQVSVDAIAKNMQTMSQEMVVLNHRMGNVEKWIGEASPKIDLKFKQ